MLKSLTGLKMLVFKDQGFITSICMYPKPGVNKNISG